MKKTLFKKSMAWLLALMMVITFMPAMAFALEAEDEPGPEESQPLEVTVTAERPTAYFQGDTVKYEVTVQNNSGDSVSGITLSPAPIEADDSQQYPFDLANGATSSTFTYEHEVTAADIKAGSITFSVTAAGENDEEETVEGTGETTVTTGPAHEKNVTPNGDGTYSIELNVTGDANYPVQTSARVNVIIVYDVSVSMTYNAKGTAYTRADQAEAVVHDFIAGLKKYQRGDGSNIEMALVTFARNSSIRQTGEENWTSDLTDSTGINRFFEANGENGSVILNYNTQTSSGTNWQAALGSANTLLSTADSDPTFVIMFTDGACTASDETNTVAFPSDNAAWTTYQRYYQDARQNAYAIQSRENTTLLGIYAYGTEANLLDDLIYYSNTGTDRPGMNGEAPDTKNYYTAADSDALEAAVESIFQQIVQSLGVSAVEIKDGTTHNVETSSSVVDLLEVDESSYKYWISIPVDSNNQFTRMNVSTAKEETYTVTDNNNGTCTVTWGTNSITVDGSISMGQFKYQWKAANALYNLAPPTAKLNGSSVDWKFGEDVTLLDGVTYSVTFDVYPSQTTLDYIAEIKNDSKFYDTLEPEVKEYLSEDGSLKTNTGATLSYKDTRVSDQTIEETFDPPKAVSTQAAEQMTVSKEWENELDDQKEKPITLRVLKDDDVEPFFSVDLSNDNNWASNVYISIGIMSFDQDDKVTVRTEGHDFHFAEPEDLSHIWQLDAPVLRPMLINGGKIKTDEEGNPVVDEEGNIQKEPTMLVKVEEEDLPTGAKANLDDGYRVVSDDVAYYKIDGKYYKEDEGAVALTATNLRKSHLDVLKVVDSDGSAPADALFEYTIQINDPTITKAGAEDIWFSIWDTTNKEYVMNEDGGTTYIESTGELKAEEDENGEYTGYYSTENNATLTIKIQSDWSLRFLNLPTDTTYTITESNMPNNFTFSKVEGERSWKEDKPSEEGTDESGTDESGTDESGTDESGTDDGKITKTEKAGTVSGQTISGTIEKTNSSYTMTFTNDYELTAVDITKTFTDKNLIPKDFNIEVTLKDKEEPVETTKASQDPITLKIKKADDDGNNVIGAGTSVEGEDGSITYTWTIDELNQGTTVTAEEKNYTIPGYKRTESPTKDEAVTSTSERAAIAFTNTYTKNTSETTQHDSVTVNKVNERGNSLSGATFQLKDGNNVVKTYSGGSFQIRTQDIASLPEPGKSKTLSLTESQAPSGYTKDSSSHSVVIKAEKGPETLVGDTFVTTTTYTITVDGKDAISIINRESGTDIEPEPVPLDLNGVDHFAYIEGYPDGTVQPEGNITRAEVATMIYRLLTYDRRDEIFTSECNYSDVAAKNWFNKAVASMTAGEYVEGYPNGSFLPNQKITRAEFVTIVVRFLEGERDAENPFTDIDGHWAKKYILSAVDAGWIDGYPDGTFRPQEPIKRDEAMKIMNTILHRGVNEESELGEPVMFPDNADPSAWYYYEVIEATNNHDTEGERPDEDWLSNECDYVYDIQKYERPDGAAPAPQDDPATPDDQDEPAVTDNSIVGQWAYTEEGVDGAFVYTFNEDGTGNYDMAGTVKAFTYTIEGNTLSILYEGDTEPFELPFVVTDTTLTVKDSNDEDVVYNKK